MDAKTFLRQIRKINILIEAKQHEIDELKNKLLTSSPSFEEKVQTSRVNNRENNLVNLVEYERMLNVMIDDLITKKQEVSVVIDQLENADQIDILYKRYFQFMEWEEIAFNKGYTYQWIHKLHARALIEVNKILEKVKQFI